MSMLPSNQGYATSPPFSPILPFYHPRFALEPRTWNQMPPPFINPNQNFSTNFHPAIINYQQRFREIPIIQEFNTNIPRAQNVRNSLENETYIVCDTNIFIHQINDVWKMVDSRNCKIVIPWKVHQELDWLKKSYNWEKAFLARTAAKHINYILENLSQKVYCQDRLQYDQAKGLFKQEDSDDSIIQAMLQLKEANCAAIFLHTYDIVLKNKALSIGLKLFQLKQQN